ncbi:hypothetical protein EYC84_011627 [Monilinia fructicola]|uniref:Uncharacterized protein n=1 Tax=Monilinia fructicola TaxID=38448 RepID=A0A5M9J8U9_MONFR|nr:hypothetical protein EYC84_011627 [Monilinia fructicola]
MRIYDDEEEKEEEEEDDDDDDDGNDNDNDKIIMMIRIYYFIPFVNRRILMDIVNRRGSYRQEYLVVHGGE